MHDVAWSENALRAGDRSASATAPKEDISEQLRESDRNRAHVRFGAPRHHARRQNEKEGHTNLSAPLVMVVDPRL